MLSQCPKSGCTIRRHKVYRFGVSTLAKAKPLHVRGQGLTGHTLKLGGVLPVPETLKASGDHNNIDRLQIVAQRSTRMGNQPGSILCILSGKAS